MSSISLTKIQNLKNRANKMRYDYYRSQRNMRGTYNYAKEVAGVFYIYRISDNKLLICFNTINLQD